MLCQYANVAVAAEFTPRFPPDEMPQRDFRDMPEAGASDEDGPILWCIVEAFSPSCHVLYFGPHLFPTIPEWYHRILAEQSCDDVNPLQHFIGGEFRVEA